MTEKLSRVRLVLPVGERDRVQGPATAPVTLVEYGDYECSYCGQAYLLIKEIRRWLKGCLRFAFRNFPLATMHPHAQRAAEAAEAAAAQNKFWEMHDYLFEHQQALDKEHLLQYAARLGFDTERFEREIAQGAHAERVRDDYLKGVRSGVTQTPTFFINGVRHDRSWECDELMDAIEQVGAAREVLDALMARMLYQTPLLHSTKSKELEETTMADKNRQILLHQYPSGVPDEHTLRMEQSSVPKPREGELAIRTLYLSVDPYLRNRMNEGKHFYDLPFQPGQILVSSAIGQVEESKHPDFSYGEIVEGMLGWQDYSLSDGSRLRKLDPKLKPLSHTLSILGVPGMTAYFGMLEVGQPQPGESVVVSAAAGAVGSAAGQIAKIKGSTVIGLAGSEEKIRYLVDELGFDKALNYKSPQFPKELQEACPDGVDLYFDNVGGTVSEIVMEQGKFRGRIVECGRVASYNDKDGGWRINLWPIHINSLRLEGFVVYRYAHRFPEATAQLTEWLTQGKLKAKETITEGLENAPKAFINLFRGASFGKQLVKVSDVT